MSIVANGTTATTLKDGEVGNFSLSFPSGTVTVHKLSQTNASGTTVYYYAGELTKTYNYSYDTISVNGTTLTSSYKLVAGTNTGIRYNAYYAKYTGGVLTLRSYRYMQTTASASTTTQLSIPSTTVKFDYTITRGSIDTVYARVGDTGSWVLVFGQGGTTTMALFFGGNWKMNNLKANIDTYFNTFNSALELNESKKVVIFPPACYLDYVKSKISSSLSSMVSVGAQLISYETRGAFTGQMSVNMAKDCGCSAVLVGHSECRQYLGITDDDCHKQTLKALSEGLKVWLCVGEPLEIREAGTQEAYVINQLEVAIGAGTGIAVSDIENGNVIINYEPIWAIGTGKTATPEQANQMCRVIRQWISTNYTGEAGQKTEIVYGGNVKVNNIEELMAQSDINGALAGGAALHADDFAQMINIAGSR